LVLLGEGLPALMYSKNPILLSKRIWFILRLLICPMHLTTNWFIENYDIGYYD
jgi:hypothetical protein